MAKRPRKGYCLGPEVRIQLRLQQLADDGGRNVLPRSICRRVVVAEKESGVVLFLLFVQLPRQQKPQDVSDSADRPPKDYRIAMLWIPRKAIAAKDHAILLSLLSFSPMIIM